MDAFWFDELVNLIELTGEEESREEYIGLVFIRYKCSDGLSYVVRYDEGKARSVCSDNGGSYLERPKE